MKAIHETELKEQVGQAGLVLESLPEGTIRLDPAPSSAPRDIPVDAVPDVGPASFLIAYREVRPVSRYAVLDSRPEVLSFITTAIANATCVDDDVYIFPSSGEFMLYVSHHNTLTIWERKPNQMPRHVP